MDLPLSFVRHPFQFSSLIVIAWLSPVWSIGGFDSCVHISEEASNASTAVPWAITSAIATAGVLGWFCVIVIAACMGTDIIAILSSPYGQPMATIYFLRLGKEGTLAIWSCMFVIQFAMGMSITISCSRQIWAFSRDRAFPFSNILRKITKKAVPVFAVIAAILLSLLIGTIQSQYSLIRQDCSPSLTPLLRKPSSQSPYWVLMLHTEPPSLLVSSGERINSNPVHSTSADSRNRSLGSQLFTCLS